MLSPSSLTPLAGATHTQSKLSNDIIHVDWAPPKIDVPIPDVADCSDILKALGATRYGASVSPNALHQRAMPQISQPGTLLCPEMDRHQAFNAALKAQRRNGCGPSLMGIECDNEVYARAKQLVAEKISGGGALAIDADEFLHCVYVIVVTLIQVSKGDGSSVEAAFRQASELLARDPSGWLKDAGVPHSIADAAVTAGMALPLLALAYLAIEGGIKEMRHARKLGKALNHALDKVDREIAALEALTALLGAERHGMAFGVAAQGDERTDADATAGNGQALPKLTAVKQERRAALRFLRKQNDADRVIGASSFASGSAIAAKCAIDTGTKAYYMIDQGSAAATTVAGAAGFLGSVALAPVASVGSLALGGYMLHKSRKKRDAFRAEKEKTDSRINEWLRCCAPTSDDEPGEHARRLRYAEFHLQKTQQHDAFFTSYTNWNKGFVTGSSLYAAGTVSKLALAGIVAAGGTALATPAAPVALTAATGAAGALMIFFSFQYLKGHGRLQRYQRYYHDDDPELDRHFLASADLLCGGERPWAGFDLRAAFYDQAASREDDRQSFLARVAKDCSRRYHPYIYTADPEEVAQRRGGKPTNKQWLARTAQGTAEAAVGRLKAASAFVRAVRPDAGEGVSQARSAWNSASAAARDAWNGSRRHLTRTSLKSWLAEPANHAEQARVLRRMVETQLDYLEQKLDIKTLAYRNIERGLNLGVQTALPPRAAEAGMRTSVASVPGTVAAAEVARLVKGLNCDIENDQRLYRQALAVRDAFKALASRSADTPAGRQLLACAIDQFLDVQQGTLPGQSASLPELQASHDRLATYLMKEAPGRYKDLRGKLVETGLQSTRILDAWHAQVSATRETQARSAARYWPPGSPARSALVL